MARHHGGERVDAGFYLDLDHWAVKTVSGKSGVLDGTADTTYLRVPTLTVLAMAPLMGAAYVVFLPFAGIAMVLQHLGRKAFAVAEDAAHATLASVSPAWRPGEAHFAGPDEKKAEEAREAKPDAQVADRLKALDEEVERRARDQR